MATQGYVVGIDLGTTNSSLAYVDGRGRPVTLLNRDGSAVTPSAVHIRKDGTVQAGAEALIASRLTPDRVARQFKRYIADKHYPHPVGDRMLSPQWLSSVILKQLADDFRDRIGPMAGAVITVPAYFGDTRRKATLDAGARAGLNVIDIINEPTAAALAGAYLEYLDRAGTSDRPDRERITAAAPKTTLVFDLGGGTFDVTVIRIHDAEFTVLATGGEVRLGGMDWDARLTDCVANEFCRRTGVDPRDDPAVLESLRLNCEVAKRTLTEKEQTSVAVTHMGKNASLILTRKLFEDATRDLVTRAELSTELGLEDASLGWNDVDEILLVGGASLMPMVRTMLRRISGLEPRYAAQPDQIVAHGAAIHAAMSCRRYPLVPCQADSSAETHVAGTLVTADETGESAVDRTGDASRKMPAVELVNVNSHSLGVAARHADTGGIINSRLLAKNTPLPAERSKVFGTEDADQRTVRVRVVEGEATEADACTQIGQCVIASLPEGLPKGSPIEVTFVYKTNGRLHVRAVEKTSGLHAECYIERDGTSDKDGPKTHTPRS